MLDLARRNAAEARVTSVEVDETHWVHTSAFSAIIPAPKPATRDV